MNLRETFEVARHPLFIAETLIGLACVIGIVGSLYFGVKHFGEDFPFMDQDSGAAPMVSVPRLR